MTKCSFYVLGLMSVLFCLSSCSKDKQGQDGPGNEIKFGVSDFVYTKAVIDKSFPEGSAFNVWGYFTGNDDLQHDVFSGTADNAVTAENTVTLQAGGKWTYPGIKYWFPSLPYYFYAIYPAGQTGVSFAKRQQAGSPAAESDVLTISKFDCTAKGADAVDLMTASFYTPQHTNGQVVDFHFNHELSRVVVKAISEGPAVTVSSAKIYEVYYTGSMTSYNQIEVPEDLKMVTTWALEDKCNADNTPFTGTGAAFDSVNGFGEKNLIDQMLMIPQNLEQSAVLEIKYRYSGETEDRVYTRNLKELSSNGWQAGKAYVYNMTFKSGAVDIKVTVNPWDEINTSVSWE